MRSFEAGTGFNGMILAESSPLTADR